MVRLWVIAISIGVLIALRYALRFFMLRSFNQSVDRQLHAVLNNEAYKVKGRHE